MLIVFFGFVLCAWFFCCCHFFILSLRLITVLLNFRTLDIKWIWYIVFIFECQLPAFVCFRWKKKFGKRFIDSAWQCDLTQFFFIRSPFIS